VSKREKEQTNSLDDISTIDLNSIDEYLKE